MVPWKKKRWLISKIPSKPEKQNLNFNTFKQIKTKSHQLNALNMCLVVRTRYKYIIRKSKTN